MQQIQRFLSGWSATYRQQGCVGKVILLIFSLLFLCFLCGVPIAILNPSDPRPEAQNTPADQVQPSAIAASTETVAEIPAAVPSGTPETAAVPFSTPTANLTALGASCIPNNPPQTGRVVNVIDGDTIKVLLDQDGQTYTVIYIGMDAPETDTFAQYFGVEASAKNSELVYGKNVTLIRDVSDMDIYKRLLRYVIVDTKFVNYELVAQGYANASSYPPAVSCISTFREVEQQASASSLGLWNARPTFAPVPTVMSSGSNPGPGNARPTIAPMPTAVSSGGGSGESSGGSSGGNALCNCSGPDLNCKDFSSHASAQACYDYCVSQGFGNIFGLDGNDNDGLACENLP